MPSKKTSHRKKRVKEEAPDEEEEVRECQMETDTSETSSALVDPSLDQRGGYHRALLGHALGGEELQFIMNNMHGTAPNSRLPSYFGTKPEKYFPREHDCPVGARLIGVAESYTIKEDWVNKEAAAAFLDRLPETVRLNVLAGRC
jgi:hypothetical protein